MEHFVPLKFQKAERLSVRYYCTKHGRSWWLDIYQSKEKGWKSLYEILCIKSVNIIKANQICLWKTDLVKQIWLLSWRRLILVGRYTGKCRLSWSTHLHIANLQQKIQHCTISVQPAVWRGIHIFGKLRWNHWQQMQISLLIFRQYEGES